jgi:hypothetical protein
MGKNNGHLSTSPRGSPPTRGSRQRYCIEAIREAEVEKNKVVLTIFKKAERIVMKAKIVKISVRGENRPKDRGISKTNKSSLGYTSNRKNGLKVKNIGGPKLIIMSIANVWKKPSIRPKK